MALFLSKNINETTRLAIWKIEEPELFFNLGIPFHKEIKHPHKRLQHLAGRFLLPLLFPDFPYHEIEIADTRKPFLAGEQYHFSISHCDNFAAAIVSSKYRVGIDVETISQKVQLIKQKFLHHDEQNFIHKHNPDDQIKLLSIAWNAKEAMYKWYGLGQVDFSEMLRIEPFVLGNEGIINAKFIKLKFEQNLLVQYQLFDQLVLAWILQ